MNAGPAPARRGRSSGRGEATAHQQAVPWMRARATYARPTRPDEAPPEDRKAEMTDDLDTMGPIDYLVVEFPGNKMTGEGLPLLVDLVDRGLIRILDLTFIRKDADGSVTGLEIGDLTGDGELDLAVFEGASSGL